MSRSSVGDFCGPLLRRMCAPDAPGFWRQPHGTHGILPCEALHHVLAEGKREEPGYVAPGASDALQVSDADVLPGVVEVNRLANKQARQPQVRLVFADLVALAAWKSRKPKSVVQPEPLIDFGMGFSGSEGLNMQLPKNSTPTFFRDFSEIVSSCFYWSERRDLNSGRSCRLSVPNGPKTADLRSARHTGRSQCGGPSLVGGV